MEHLLSLFQGVQGPDRQQQNLEADLGYHELDTNVMYDPATGEGLVCVNGRCISNKKKMQMHDENALGLRSGNGRPGYGGNGRDSNQSPNRRNPMD